MPPSKPHFGLQPKTVKENPFWFLEYPASSDPGQVFESLILQRKAEKLPGSVLFYSAGDLCSGSGGQLTDLFTERMGEPASVRYSDSGDKGNILWVWDKGMLKIFPLGSPRIECATTDENVLKWVMDAVKPCQVDVKTKSSIWMASRVSAAKPMHFRRMGTVEAPMERGNYSPEVLAKYDLALADIKSADPKGRILLMEGPPGSGKTWLAKGLIHDSVANYVVVNPKNYEDLMDPEFISGIEDEFINDEDSKLPIIFVLEDADKLLQPRQMGASLGGLSSALNMGDGLISSLMDVRIIATTNAPIKTIDPAITRAGRLSQCIHVGELSAEQATEVYRRLLPKSKWRARKPTMLADLYLKARQHGWVAPSKDGKEGIRRQDVGPPSTGLLQNPDHQTRI